MWLQEQFRQHIITTGVIVDNVHNIDRILRIPGTINFPNKKKVNSGRVPVKAKLISPDSYKPVPRYTLEDFQQITSAQEANCYQVKALPASSIDLTKIGIPKWLHSLIQVEGATGDRSRMVLKVTGELVREGINDEVIRKILMTPGFAISSHILEQSDPERAVRRAIQTVRQKQNKRINPEAGSKSEFEHWQLEPWPERVRGNEVLDEIVSALSRFIYLPDNAKEAIALWVLHAWTIEASDISPFLTAVSPTRQCGKTTLLTLIYYLTPKSILASNLSPASIFRFIEQHQPTLLMDEADSFFRESEELRGILNSGFTRSGANVIRCIKDGTNYKTIPFSTWTPKVIATIGAVADTLMDRSIIVHMQRKPRDVKLDRLRMRDNDEFIAIRRKCLRWAEDNLQELGRSDPHMPDELDNRPADTWRPLVAIADCSGAEWASLARLIAIALTTGKSHDDDFQVELLRDIREIFRSRDETSIASQKLTEELISLPEGRWGDFGRGGKPISARKLAQMLSEFGIKSVKTRGARQYHRSDFEKAFSSYLSS